MIFSAPPRNLRPELLDLDEAPFEDLGIDSMMAIEIVAEVERTYKLSIPEDELQTMTNFTRVYELVRSKLPADAAE